MSNNIEVTEENTFNFINGYTDKEGAFHTDFSIREMNGNDEEAIGKNTIKHNGAKIIRTVLERCCFRIGTLYKKDFKPTKWVEIIQDLDVAEQDRMLVCIRKLSLGDELELSNTCPNSECKHKLTTYMDIDELEVVEYNGVDKIEFSLPKGIKSKEGTLMKNGILRRPRGIDREVLDSVARKNIGTANTLLITRCMVELEGKKVNDNLVRKMTLRDRDYLINTLKDNMYGYNLEMELTCPVCGEDFMATLNVVNFI